MSDILINPTDIEIAEAIEANQIEYVTDLVHSPFVELHDDPEKTWLISDQPDTLFNRVVCARFNENYADTAIENTLKLFRSRNASMIWHTGPTSQPGDLGKRLVEKGLTLIDHEPGMALDLNTLEDRMKFSSPLIIEQVNNDKLLKEWSRIFTIAFNLPKKVTKYIFNNEKSIIKSQIISRKHYVGFLEGKPVASSLLLLRSGVAGIYCVGTLPPARRKGFGEVMTIVPLIEAKKLGYRIATLHASKLGIGIYEKLGFKEYCTLSRYMFKNEP